MKVILSRKGFDSKAGFGFPSPILPDDRLISLPVPSNGDKIRYSDLMLENDTAYSDLIPDLKGYECHLDPDLIKDLIPRKPGWKPMFGQIGASQTSLENNNVKENDLFLFFGWFRKLKQDGSNLVFNGPHLHVIFGYLQIGEKIRLDRDFKVPAWMTYHPHTSKDRKEAENNTVYVAREKLSWDSNLRGAGIFKFNPKLQLTKEGYSRSRWRLPEFFKDVNMSYKPAWNPTDKYFQSAGRGQEFVIQDNPEVEEWAKKIIYSGV